MARIHPHETLHPQLPYCWPEHHGICPGSVCWVSLGYMGCGLWPKVEEGYKHELHLNARVSIEISTRAAVPNLCDLAARPGVRDRGSGPHEWHASTHTALAQVVGQHTHTQLPAGPLLTQVELCMQSPASNSHGPVPNKPQPGSGPWPGGVGGPCTRVQKTLYLCRSLSSFF